MFRFIKFIIKAFLLLLLIAAGVVAYANLIEPHMLSEEYVEIDSPHVSPEAEGIQIALLSDTHFSEHFTLEDFQEVLDSIEEHQPDIVFFTGDLIDNFDQYSGDVRELSKALDTIEAPIGKFAIFGNHDYGGGAEKEYAAILEAGGFHVLKNDYFPLDAYQLSIVGIDDFMLGYGDIGKATWARDDYFNILLCHEPDIVDLVLDYNIDLMLSGHTHGGQIHLPGYTEEFLPPYGENYVKGLYEFQNLRSTSLYVNPGLGTTKIPLRFLSTPEITYITLKNTTRL